MPSIYLQFSNFDNLDLEDDVKYYKIDIPNQTIVDSTTERERNNEIIELIGNYSSRFQTEYVLELEKSQFLIQTTVSNDTIYNINFDTETYKQKCNTCFLASDIEIFTKIQNFSFYHNGIQYFDDDTIIITQ